MEQTELSIHSSIVKVLEHWVEDLQEDWMEHKTLAVKSCTQELKNLCAQQREADMEL